MSTPESPKKKSNAKRKEFLATLTRLALEAKVAEELELKRREQLEKKLQMEEAQRQMKEAEERRIEKLRLGGEMQLESSHLEEYRRNLTSAYQQAQAVVGWYKSLECRALPSPDKDESLNTFLSLWRSETPDDTMLSVVPLVEQCAVAEAVAQLVQTTQGVALEDRNADRAKWYSDYVAKLRLISKNKIDDFTRTFLEHVDSTEPSLSTNTYSGLNQGFVHIPQQGSQGVTTGTGVAAGTGAGTGTGIGVGTSALGSSLLSSAPFSSSQNASQANDVEILRCWGSPTVSLGLWAHARIPPEASRRIRIPLTPFGMEIELPSALQSARTAIRVIWTRYNHVFEERPADGVYISFNQKAAARSTKLVEQEAAEVGAEAERAALTAGEDPATAASLGEAAAKAHKFTSSFRDRPGLALGMDVWPLLGPESAISPDDIIVPATDCGSSRASKDFIPGFGPTRPILTYAEDETRAQQTEQEELETAMRCAEIFASPSARTGYLSPCYYTSVGGMITIEQLRLPPAPLSWGQRIAPVLSLTTPNGRLVPVPYPSNESLAGSASEGPLTVTFSLPDDIVVEDTPLLAYWHASMRAWKTDSIQVRSYNPQTRRLEVRVAQLLPFAVIQPRALDFPYHRWTVGPNGPGTLQVAVQGSRFQVVFELVGHTAKLVAPKLPALRSLLGVPMEPGLLLLRLQQRGIDLLPSDADAYRLRMRAKSRRLEEILHEQVASVAALCHVQSIIWNGQQGSDAALLTYQLAGPESALLPEGLKDPAEELLQQVGVKYSPAHIGNSGFVAAVLPPIIPGSSPAAAHMGQEALLEAQISASGASGKLFLSPEDETQRGARANGLSGSQGNQNQDNGEELQNPDEAVFNAIDPAVRATDLETYELLVEATATEQKLNKLVEEGTHTAQEAGLALDQRVSELLGPWRAVLMTEEKCLAVVATGVNPSTEPRPGRASHITLRRVVAEERALDMVAKIDQELAHAQAILARSQQAIDAVPVPDLDLQAEHAKNQGTVEQLAAKRARMFNSHLEEGLNLFSKSDESNLVLVQQTCRKLLNLLRPFSFS